MAPLSRSPWRRHFSFQDDVNLLGCEIPSVPGGAPRTSAVTFNTDFITPQVGTKRFFPEINLTTLLRITGTAIRSTKRADAQISGCITSKRGLPSGHPSSQGSPTDSTANKQTATDVTVTPSASANIAVGLGHATPTLSAIPSGNRTVLPPALAASVDEVPVSIGYVNGASTSASPSDSSALLPTAVPVNENGRTLSSSSSSSKSSITYLTGASTSTVSASGGSGLSSILSMLKSVDTQTLHLSSTSSSATRPTSGTSSSITHPTSSTTSKAAVVHVEVSSEYTSTMSSSSGSMEPSKTTSRSVTTTSGTSRTSTSNITNTTKATTLTTAFDSTITSGSRTTVTRVTVTSIIQPPSIPTFSASPNAGAQGVPGISSAASTGGVSANTSAIIGGSVGAAAFVLALLLLAFFFFRRRRQNEEHIETLLRASPRPFVVPPRQGSLSPSTASEPPPSSGSNLITTQRVPPIVSRPDPAFQSADAPVMSERPPARTRTLIGPKPNSVLENPFMHPSERANGPNLSPSTNPVSARAHAHPMTPEDPFVDPVQSPVIDRLPAVLIPGVISMSSMDRPSVLTLQSGLTYT